VGAFKCDGLCRYVTEGLATASVAMLSKMISPYDVTKAGLALLAPLLLCVKTPN
jgi:hypothetical protein